MNSKDRIKKNALISILQIIISSLTLFLVYKLVLDRLGVEQLGLWSVVSAVISNARIGQLGLSGAVVKYVSSNLALNKRKEAAKIVETAFYSTLIATTALLIIIYPALIWFIQLSVPESNITEALALIPYVSTYFLVITSSSVFLSGLDGCHRYDLKGYIMIAGHLLLLVLTFFLLDSLGIRGLIIAQIIQASVLCFLGWFFIKRILNIKRVVPLMWNKKTFMSIWKYGANFQVITISQMLYDPTTKMLLTYFGGLEITGIYEMANRLVTQARAIPTTANQVLLPYISEQYTLNKQNNIQLYKSTFNLLFYISTPYYALLALFLPIIAWLWLDAYQTLFLIFGLILIFGAWINTLSSPAYFSFLGVGYLKWVVISHVIIAIINLLLGYIIGNVSNIGPAIGWSVALIFGSLLTLVASHKENKILFKDVQPIRKMIFTLMVFFYLLIFYWVLIANDIQELVYIFSFFSIVIFFMLLVPALWYFRVFVYSRS